MQYTGFIPQNAALPGARRIGIYDSKGNRAGFIPLGSLAMPEGKKRYSFGALSDVHVVLTTGAEDFEKALTYLNETEDVAFTCICGDLTQNATEEEFTQYKELVDACSPDTPVYAIAGNHESYDGIPVTTEKIQPYTGQPFYYSFTHGEDVFVLCGCYSSIAGEIFTTEELQWLYETLEANRNRRCFVFQHVMPWDDSGNAKDAYAYGDLFAGTLGNVFRSLLAHYKNTVFFHGHSHMKFGLQEADETANYSEASGYRSVHIPSLCVPRDIVDDTLTNLYSASEGYVVDVYENGIHLRGRDFAGGAFLPIANYWIDTTLQTVEAGTYTDSTGTIG